MLDKAQGYGYKRVGFILDRGYFSKANIDYMDSCGYSFVIMVKGMSELVDSLMMEHKGSFESKRACDMDGFGVYGKTVKRKLYETEELIKAISTSKRSYEDILAYIQSAK